jgi:NAD dependent epimerase/dehydratase family enzyme
VSWVHLDDLCSIFRFLLEDEKARGSFNATAPNPVTMRAFARALGRALHRPSALPVPKPVLRVALGEVAETLTTGQLVIPRRTLEAGFRFAHPEIDEALASLFDRRAETLERR